jgi:hypothetical protein
MSNHAHDQHTPEPREFSHPVLWTIGLVAIMGGLGWVFFHYLGTGAVHVKGEPKFAMPVKGPSGPDHAALIAARGPEVLDRGEILYGKNCASCHGANGDANPSNIKPVPRLFRTEAMKNPLGNGPYAWYDVLSKGYGVGMPGFRNLPPADRYAVLHFVRERWIKPAGASFYVEVDAPEVAKQIPAAGGAASAEAVVDPATVVPPPAVYGVMAKQAAAVDDRAVVAWLDQAEAGADSSDSAGLAALRALARSRPALAADLLTAARAGGVPDLAKALAATVDPTLALMRATDLNRLAARLVAAAKG